MRKLFLAAFLTLLIGVGVLSAEVHLVDGTEVPLKIVDREGNQVLVKGERGHGYLPAEWFAGERLDVLGIDDALKQAREQLAAGDEDGALRTLQPVIDQDPSHPSARRLLATVQRRRGRFEAALFLLNGLHDEASAEGKASVDLVRERAEVAVLTGDRSLARRPLADLKKHREERVWERKLSRQLNGHPAVTFARPLPPALDPQVLAKNRAEHDNRMGTSDYAAAIAARIERHFNASTFGVTAQNAFVRRIRVSTTAQDHVVENYLAGGDEARFAALCATATVKVAVDEKRWLGLWDWQKKIEVDACARMLRNAFPNAVAYVQIIAQKGEDEKSRYTVARATVLRRSFAPQVTFLTPARFDTKRGDAIFEELRNYRR